ncbi:hypothetical protein B0H10DRAFT_1961461 [Mycena sp. CBHHK59/15]|nr:hypothetical protein B0H10DRAFT_1961461 [Mycena sp. CBHHK59/15]
MRHAVPVPLEDSAKIIEICAPARKKAGELDTRVGQGQPTLLGVGRALMRRDFARLTGVSIGSELSQAVVERLSVVNVEALGCLTCQGLDGDALARKDAKGRRQDHKPSNNTPQINLSVARRRPSFAGRYPSKPSRYRPIEIFLKTPMEQVGYPSHGPRRTGATESIKARVGDAGASENSSILRYLVYRIGSSGEATEHDRRAELALPSWDPFDDDLERATRRAYTRHLSGEVAEKGIMICGGSVGKVQFSSGSGRLCPNAKPEPGVRFREWPNLEPELAFRFSSAFEHVRT